MKLKHLLTTLALTCFANGGGNLWAGIHYTLDGVPSVDYTSKGSAPTGGKTYALYNETSKFLYFDGNAPKISATKTSWVELITTGSEFYFKTELGLLYKQNNSNWNTWADGNYGDIAKWSCTLNSGKYKLQNHNKANASHYFAPNSNGEGIQCYSDKTSLTGWYFIDLSDQTLAISLLYQVNLAYDNYYSTAEDGDAKTALGTALDNVYANYVKASSFTSDTYASGAAEIEAAIVPFYVDEVYAPVKVEAQEYLSKYPSSPAVSNLNSAISTQDAAIAAATTKAAVDEAKTALKNAISSFVTETLSSITGSEGGMDVTSWITNPTPTSNSTGWTTSSTPGYANNTAQFWNVSGASISQTLKALPAGFYRLTCVAFTRTGKTATLAAGEQATMNIATVANTVVNSQSAADVWFNKGFGVNELDFHVPTDQDVTITLTADNSSADYWMVWRSFKLTYAGTEEENLLNLEKYLDSETLTVANAAKTGNPNVTGSELTALNSAISAFDALDATATVSDQVAARKAAKYNLVEAKNVLVDAAPSYNALALENTRVAELGGTGYTVTSETTAAIAAEKVNEIRVAEYYAVMSNYLYEVELGDWTPSGDYGTSKSQHWDGTSTSDYLEQSTAAYQNSNWSLLYTQNIKLPAGDYVFKVAGRHSANSNLALVAKEGETILATVNDFPTGDTGLGIDINGATNFTAAPEGETLYANNNNGRGWQWRYVPFTLDEESTITVSVDGSCSGYTGQWLSFCNATIRTKTQKPVLYKAIEVAEATDKTANVGTGVFQIPASAVTAFNDAISAARAVYDDAEATNDDVNDAIADLATATTAWENPVVNAPEAGKRYKIVVAADGHAKKDNAVVVSLGATSDNNKTGYNFNASAAPVDYLAQAVQFDAVEGKANTYNIIFTAAEGDVYLTYGSLNNSAAGWKTQQIQGTTVASAKGEFKIVATSTDNVFNIVNTVYGEGNTPIVCQDNGALYTEAGAAAFTIAEATEASVELSIAAGKLATRIFPFTPVLPDGVEAYSCDAVDGTSLTLTKVDAPEANKPYILYSENAVTSTNLTGWGNATTDKYTQDYLTGVYTEAEVPTGSYVLQTQSGVQGFYKVAEAAASSAYRVYVTVPEESGVKMFTVNFEGLADAIKAAREAGETTVRYNLAGQRVNDAQKGIVIVNGKKVLVK